MEKRQENDRENMRRYPGNGRIKNITNDVEEHKFDQELDTILPKTDWETRMAAARTSTARMKAAALKDSGGAKAREADGPGRNAKQDGSGVPGERQPRSGAPGERQPRHGGPSYSSKSRSRSGAAARPMTRPANVSRLSREFEEDDRPKNIRPSKKKSNMPAKVIAALAVLLIIIGSVFLITSYGQGSSINQKGLKLYNNGEYAQAVDMFESALAKDEGNSEYLVNLGMTYIALGEYDNALAAFDTSIANTNRSELLELAKRGSGIVYLSSGHYSKAVNLFKEALAHGGDSYDETMLDILYYLAEAQDKAGDAQGAVQSYTSIIDHQSDANAYMLRGLAYQNAGDNEKAEADLKTALGMSKKNYKIYLALYEVLCAQQKTDEAALILDEALNLGGKTGEDYSNRGIVYMYKEDYEGAADAFNTALEKGYNGAYLGLAQSLVNQEDYEGAAAQYEQYISGDTTNAAAYNEYGLCLLKLLRYEDALSAFDAGLALNDRLVDKELMYNAAVTLEYMNDWAGAYERMKAFTQKYPDDAQGQHELTFLESTQY